MARRAKLSFIAARIVADGERRVALLSARRLTAAAAALGGTFFVRMSPRRLCVFRLLDVIERFLPIKNLASVVSGSTRALSGSAVAIFERR